MAVASTTPSRERVGRQSPRAPSAPGYAAKSNDGELVVCGGAGPRASRGTSSPRASRPTRHPSRLHTVVDARSGAVITSWDDIVTGTGNSMYSGTVTLNTIPSGSSWLLKDTHGNYTTDLNGSTSSTAAGTQFTDADNKWGAGTASDRQTAGVDAEYGAEKTSTPATTSSAATASGTTGPVPAAASTTAARRSTPSGRHSMTYGDGSDNAQPLTSVDVAAHEMSHGVTENTAGLNYCGDAGGLNEATSDIFGTAVEFYANKADDPGDYLIGEKVDINGNGTPLRYMDDPSKDGVKPDCWTTRPKNLDPHYSSGALNHWFFMASEGSGAKTVNGVSYNSPVCGGAAAVTGRAAPTSRRSGTARFPPS